MDERNHEIVGLEKVQEKMDEVAKWNNSIIRWTILHNTSTGPKTYDIELSMIYLSSKRIVKVNGEIKHTQMRTFGYSVMFPISQSLQGKIQQDGVSFQFQLYVNGYSFTHLSQQNYHYEPVNIEKPTNHKYQQIIKPNQEKAPIVEEKRVKIPSKIEENSPQTEAEKIKNTQKELLKILKAEKRKK